MSAPPRINRIALFLFIFVLLILPFGAISAGDNNINWNELGFNSRDTLYRSPVGAVPVGTDVRVRLKALDGDLTSAQVRAWNDRINGELLIDMTRIVGGVSFPGDPNLYEFWEATLPASALPTVYWYRFIVKDGSATAYYEDDAARDQGWGSVFGGSPDNSYQLTFYDPTFQTPDWVKDAVIYQIFVDRFRDGNPANNTPAGSFFYGNNDTIVRSNGTDWNTRVCDPRAAAGSTSICANGYSNNFYGGDLQGVIDQLDYIDGLGVTAIYLNPIFESPSNHKYDTTNYYEIDDNFGNWSLFNTLTTQAHARGINIILDGVFNHTSSDSVYFDRYSHFDVFGGTTTIGTNDGSGACESESSGFVDWFFFQAGTGCSNGRGYESWFGYDSLPKLNGANAEVREIFIDDNSSADGDPIAIARYWMQWADGWRLDVGGDLDQGTLNSPTNDYWEDFRAAVHATNPNAYIVGEEWGNSTSWTIDNQWDATMNYQYSSAFLSFFRDETFTDNDHNGGSSAGNLSPITPSQFSNRIENWQERYAPEAFYAMMNLLGSHDTSRPLFMLDDQTDTATTATYNNPAYDWTTSIQRMLGVVLLQMTMPGAPTIYYGDEVGTVNPPAWDGSQWQDDPYNRVPYPWLDQTGTPYYTHMQVSFAQDAMRQYYTRLTTARNGHPALRTGEYIPLLLDDTNDVIAYLRIMDDDSDAAVVIVNGSSVPHTVTINTAGYLPGQTTLYEELTQVIYVTNPDGTFTFNAPARSGGLFTVSAAVTGRPSNVTDLSATQAANQITLNWSDAANAGGYDVYRSPLSGGAYQYLASPTSSEYQDTGLSNGQRYYYMVIAKSNTGLASDWSNEVSSVPGYNLDPNAGGVWYNLQWPHTITHTLNLNNPTETIYGKIWISGATDAQSQTVAGIRAQVGYGPQSDHPSSGSWTWFEMTPNQDGDGNNYGGNDDEYKGNLLPTSAGTFYYTTRYSADGGASWFYTDKNAPPYDAADAGVLTVNQSDDTTPPAAPTNLEVLATTSTSVTLGWDAHPNTDGDLAGFEIWRETVLANPNSDELFGKIATVADPTATQYVDTTATPDTTYNYYIKAYDTATNASDPSNTVSATSEFRMVNVTFNVTVPAGTPATVYIAGSFPSPYPEWNPGGIALTYVDNNVWSVTLSILDGTQIQYKYARGAWERVEKEADGNTESNNRQVTISYGLTGNQIVDNTVANWRDPFAVHVSPEPETNTDGTTNVTVVWNQAMNTESVTNPAGFELMGDNGAIDGVLTYNAATYTTTFTPNQELLAGNYGVEITGRTDAGGDNQQVVVTWMFDVGTPPGQVTAIAPLGTVNASPSDYSWYDVPTAEWYQIWVSGPDGYLYSNWYDAYYICTAGVCTVDVPLNEYDPGTYSWWIQAWGDGGYGAWSNAFNFAVATTPASATPGTPNGLIDTGTPTFTWADVAGVDWYYLWVANGVHILDQWYNTNDICTGGTCSVTPALNLATGNYQWWLQTYSDVGGFGAWSNGQMFQVNMGITPPTPTAPLGVISDTTPDFQWNGVSGAEWYYVWLSDGTTSAYVTDQWFDAYLVCAGGVCTINTGMTLTEGHTYRWWVMSWSSIAGYSVWSAEQNFTVEQPTLILPEPPAELPPVETPIDEVIPPVEITPELPVDEVTPESGA